MVFYLLEKTKMRTPSLPLDYKIRYSSSLKGKKPSLILLHGYGSNEEDLFSFATYLPNEYTIISLRAPIALDMGGYAWNNIHFDDSGDKKIIIQEANNSLELIKESIKLSITHFNLDDNDIGLIGFSQGCILSWAMTINHPNLIRRAVALSGFIVPKLIKAPLEEVSQLLMFNSHGVLDQMIPVEKARQSINLIKKNNPKITYKEYNEGHGINQENFSDFLNWINTTSL
ncbi:MAG: phospholipase [Flavobacteriaceae bacterium]|nr:phospholipase [Flavobacteriaceae bacterium]